MTDWTKDPAMIEAMAKSAAVDAGYDETYAYEYMGVVRSAASVLPDFVVPKVDVAGLDGLVERLLLAAKSTSDAKRAWAEAKSLRQEGNAEGRTDLYTWPTPEQTVEGQAAAALQSLTAQLAEANRLIAIFEPLAVGALKEAREALHFHYVEWDGEPEDAVPLQLARAKCDQAIAVLSENASIPADAGPKVDMAGLDGLVERVNALRREVELRWTGTFADNTVNTLDEAATALQSLTAQLAETADLAFGFQQDAIKLAGQLAEANRLIAIFEPLAVEAAARSQQ